MKKNTNVYPIIDLFAGPGGLGEGFACLLSDKNHSVFQNVVSIERDELAHKTLILRHFYRSFGQRDVPESYYKYIAGEIERDELIRQYPANWKEARMSSHKISLGTDTHSQVKSLIKRRLGAAKKWALVGGPPCQAYSIVGRSRMMGNPDFNEDERHFLYKEYLKTIIDHRPPVFVMENVLGLLSAKVNGEAIMQKIVNDLSSPINAIRKKKNGLNYKLYSLTTKGELKDGIDPKSFIVKAEEFGVPQARHRIFILGIRSDIDIRPELLQKKKGPSVEQVIRDMPKIRSGVSQQKDNVDLWRKIIKSAEETPWYKAAKKTNSNGYTRILKHCLDNIASSPTETSSKNYFGPRIMRKWYYDERLSSISSHESRFHMESDLHRYLFAATYSEAKKVSPTLTDFPVELLPAHSNVEKGRKGKMFSDRFRVQVKDRVSTTITSHISKDGHYFIHYDPTQCRSLTVREAARLQTFPDNYHFEGPRTSQYHQVGNAVPPYLAVQIAEIIKDILDKIPDK